MEDWCLDLTKAVRRQIRRRQRTKALAAILADDPAVRQHNEAINEIVEIIDPMLRHNDGFSLRLPFGHDVVESLGGRAVKIGGWLIENVNRRIDCGHRSTRQPLLLAARKRED